MKNIIVKEKIVLKENIPSFEECMSFLDVLLDKKELLVYEFVLIQLNTGLKCKEILNLRWNDILDKTNIVNKGYNIELDDDFIKRVKDLFELLEEKKTNRLLLTQKKTVSSIQWLNREIKRCTTEYGFRCKDATTKTFRKTFASRLLSTASSVTNGLRMVKKILNHSNASITARMLLDNYDNLVSENVDKTVSMSTETNAYKKLLISRIKRDIDKLSREEKLNKCTKKVDCVYVYDYSEFGFKVAYVGRCLMRLIEERDIRHCTDRSEATSEFSFANRIPIPKMTILKENLTLKEGLELEDYYRKEYANNGYEMLNKGNTGINCGSLGAIDLDKILLEEELEKEIEYANSEFALAMI